MDDIAREHIDINTLRVLYSRYKDFIVPFLAIVAVIGLFVKITIPATADLLKGYEEQKVTIQTLENLRRKLNFVKTLDASSLTSQFNVVNKALPIVKDFDGILNAISDSSNKSGVELGGFKFTIGSLSEEEAVNEILSLNLNLTLIGNVEAVDNFIGQLVKTLPLSEITKVSAEKDSSEVAIDFYYKPIKPSKHDDSLPLNIVSAKGLSLIDELSAFSMPQTSIIDQTSQPSTPSANPFF